MSDLATVSPRALKAARYVLELMDPAASLQADYEAEVHALAVVIEDKADIRQLEHDVTVLSEFVSNL